mgnify:CR=1 FL=1|jgi:hypothetical protein
MNNKKPVSSPDVFWKLGGPDECELPVLIVFLADIVYDLSLVWSWDKV